MRPLDDGSIPSLPRDDTPRRGMIAEWDVLLSSHGTGKRFAQLIGTGALYEPFKGTRRFEVIVQGASQTEVEAGLYAGAFMSIKPVIKATVWLPFEEIGLLTPFVAARRKLYVEFVFTKPIRARGAIRSFEFSLRPLD